MLLTVINSLLHFLPSILRYKSNVGDDTSTRESDVDLASDV